MQAILRSSIPSGSVTSSLRRHHLKAITTQAPAFSGHLESSITVPRGPLDWFLHPEVQREVQDSPSALLASSRKMTLHAIKQARLRISGLKPLAETAKDWLLYSSAILGATGCSTILAINQLLGLPFNGAVLSSAFFMYWASVLFDHLKDCRSESDMKNHPLRSAFLIKNHGILSGLLKAGTAAFVASLTSLEPLSLLPIAYIVLVCITYPLKLLPGKKALKSIPGVKLFQVGSCHAAAIVLFPILASGGSLLGDPRIAQLALALFFFGVSNNNLNDIKDIDGDRIEGIRTLAVALGASGAYCFSLLSAATAAALLFSLQTPGTSVAAALWLSQVLMWDPAKPSRWARWQKQGKIGWLDFTMPIVLLGTPEASSWVMKIFGESLMNSGIIQHSLIFSGVLMLSSVLRLKNRK